MAYTSLIIDHCLAAREDLARIATTTQLFDELRFSADLLETRQQLDQRPVDMIFCGWRPETTGQQIEILAELHHHEEWADIPVVALAPDQNMPAKLLALENGIVDYQIYATDPRELEARMRVQIHLKERTRKLREEKNQLARLARTDTLTGLYNRAHFDAGLEIELSRCRRSQQPLALLMIDLDYFKSINDNHGHPCGDRVLQTVGETLNRITRCSDLVCRYGGEEFAVILPETSLTNAYAVAEKIRRTLMALELCEGRTLIPVTASIGISGTRRKEELTQAAELLREADQALYLSKQRGRNRTEIFRPVMPTPPRRPYPAYPHAAIAFA